MRAGLQPDTSAQTAPFSAREIAIGRREHPKILAAYGGAFSDPEVGRFLGQVTSRLQGVSDRPDLKFRVTVLNSPSINAFSLPGGYIYVTRGLLALANDEAEIAAVIAHEMAHITARHAIAREEEAVSAAVVSQVVSDVVRNSDGSAAAMALSRGRLAHFSRQQEFEADVIGIRTAGRAGYDPGAAVSFLRSLERQTNLHSRRLYQDYDPNRVDMFSTHPATPQRIVAAEREARFGGDAGGAERGRDPYLKSIDGILYGDDPTEGYVQGRTFLHAQLGLTFTLPRGYALENTPNAVVGFAQSGDIIRFDGVTVPAHVPPGEYLRQGAIKGGDVTDIRPMNLNGQPAASARVQGNGWQFHIIAVRGRSTAVYRFILASKDLKPDDLEAFRSAAMTFRLIGPEETRLAKPLHVRVITVGSGDTIESLAAQMNFAEHSVERFRVLNGLGPGDRVQPGQMVKVVVR